MEIMMLFKEAIPTPEGKMTNIMADSETKKRD